MISPLAEPNFLDQIRDSAFSLWDNIKRTISTPFGQKTANPVASPSPYTNTRGDQVTDLPGGGQRIIFNQGASPTPTPIPQPSIPPVTPTQTNPYVPQDIHQTYYTNRNQNFTQDLYKAISSYQVPDYLKRLALALATQESSGGANLQGDTNKQGVPQSFGPYHIYDVRKPEIMKNYGIKTDEEYYQKVNDPYWSTQYFFDEMAKYLKKGNTPEQALKKWNSRSGYVNAGPKYDVDLPQMATTSSFFTK